MPTSDLIKKQHDIFHQFNDATSFYENQKIWAKKEFDKTRESTESEWQNEHIKADRDLEELHRLLSTTQSSLNVGGWENAVEGGQITSLHLINNSSSQSIGAYRSTAVQASRNISEFLTAEEKPSTVRGRAALIAILSAFMITIIASIILNSLFGSIALLLSFPLIIVLFWVIFTRLLKIFMSKLRNAYANLAQAVEGAEKAHKLQLIAPREKYQRGLKETQDRYEASIKTLEQRLSGQLTKLQQEFSEYVNSVQMLGFLGTTWTDATWKQQWQPVSVAKPLTRIGTLTARQDLPIVPALIACPSGQNILFKTQDVGKDRAAVAIEALILRLLATQPPSKVRFTLIDSVGSGESLAAFVKLADYDEELVGPRVWTESRQIEEQLANLQEQMEMVIQKRLQGKKFATLEEYNAQAEVTEPYRVLVVMGFPAKFTTETANRLLEITSNGRRAGFSTIVLMDTVRKLPYDFSVEELERVSTIIEWSGQQFVWQKDDQQQEEFKNSVLVLDTPPVEDLFSSLLEKIGTLSKNAGRVAVPFEKYAPDIMHWWSAENKTYSELSVTLGPASATKAQMLTLGSDSTGVHALVVGKTGSGKTNLLHVLIMGLALKYSPDELELYLVDFKTVGFTPYARFELPHARVVATESEREFGLSVLQKLEKEMRDRQERFKLDDQLKSIHELDDYRKKYPQRRMPRILLLVDEFQEFFTYDDQLAQEALRLLDTLIRQGRSFGIHVMLGSQTIGGSYTLAGSTIRQMAVRIAMQCEEEDSRLILGQENTAARLLSRPGEAIYNASNGAVGKNNNFQCAYLSGEKLDEYLGRVRDFAHHEGYTAPTRQIIFKGNANAEVEKNEFFAQVLATNYLIVPQRAVPVWLGDPIAIKDPTSVLFRSQGENNLLIVGQQEEVALGMQIIAFLSLIAQYTPGTARFYVADFSHDDVPHAGQWEHVKQLLPIDIQDTIKIVNKRRNLSKLITEIADEVADRMEKEESTGQPIYLFIYGLQRARDLRPDEEFGFSSYGNSDSAPVSLSKQFATILHEGPDFGVHTLAWCDTLSNLNRSLERGALREFGMRVVFQMSQEDSMSLVDGPAASKLGYYRALLFTEETVRLEKFRPYGLPSEEWLKEVADKIQQKQSKVS